jgi:hypothetical protein
MVLRGALQLTRVLDDHHTVAGGGDLGEQRIGERGLAGRGRSSDILPGIRRLKRSFAIAITLDLANAWSSRGAIGVVLSSSCSFVSQTARWPIFRYG